jgi:hypothetical protein
MLIKHCESVEVPHPLYGGCPQAGASEGADVIASAPSAKMLSSIKVIVPKV